jgi:hypothetical protein
MCTKSKVASLTLIGFLILTLSACARQGGTTEEDVFELGRKLTTGCHACHTPKVFTDHGPVPDSTLAFSGHPQNMGIPEIQEGQLDSGWLLFNDHMTCWVGPWGAVFARNLTPDMQTGIGSWDEKTFIRVMRTGRHIGSEHILAQPMPWLEVAKKSDKDLKAIFIYLRSLEPIKNAVPGPITSEELAKLAGEQ